MRQVVNKNVSEQVKPNTYYTLLVDGNNLLQVASSADKTISSTGKPIGGVFQFLLQLKLMLQKATYKYIIVVFDGDNSGELRYHLNPDYKQNRDKTYSNNENLSDYAKQLDEKIRQMQQYIFNKNKKKKVDEEDKKEVLFWQRDVVISCLEELFITSVLCDKVEGDDLIGYYVKHKEPNEKIVILSNDRDLSQLISEDVIVYIQQKKTFVTTKNCKEVLNIHHKNILLKKIILGDTSDSIKGVKGVGEKTLMEYFPEFKSMELDLKFVIDRAKLINEQRVNSKKKPLKWCENLIDGITDGKQKGSLYEVNKTIIDLREPLMTEEAIEVMDSIMHNTIDPTDRSFKNLYNIIKVNNIEPLYDYNKFSGFFIEFKYYIDRILNV